MEPTATTGTAFGHERGPYPSRHPDLAPTPILDRASSTVYYLTVITADGPIVYDSLEQLVLAANAADARVLEFQLELQVVTEQNKRKRAMKGAS